MSTHSTPEGNLARFDLALLAPPFPGDDQRGPDVLVKVSARPADTFAPPLEKAHSRATLWSNRR